MVRRTPCSAVLGQAAREGPQGTVLQRWGGREHGSIAPSRPNHFSPTGAAAGLELPSSQLPQELRTWMKSCGNRTLVLAVTGTLPWVSWDCALGLCTGLGLPKWFYVPLGTALSPMPCDV